MSQTISFRNVIRFYQGLKHQDTALAWLADNIPAEVSSEFLNRWREPEPPTVTGHVMPEEALDLIRQSEGLVLKAYPDPGTGGAPWTIGYGHTGGVTPGQEISRQQAEAFLLEDIAEASATVERLVRVDLDSLMYGALVSLVFNIGASAFAASTLLARINQKLYDEAADQFDRWVYAGGRVLPGLVSRRSKEKALFSAGLTRLRSRPIPY